MAGFSEGIGRLGDYDLRPPCLQSLVAAIAPPTPVWNWEVPAALASTGSEAGDFLPRSLFGGRRVHMKNTGKRIFFAAVVFALTNAAFLVAAGNFTSQR